jgi:hypothetical protein
MRNAYKISVGISEGKRPVRRYIRKYKNKFRMHLQEIGCEDVGWIHLAQDMVQWQSLVYTVMNLRFGNFFPS